ncbi:MAG: sensor histidine kinase [Cyclobacteriaceae bacterium]
MVRKPFKVSARVARLIGRENVANADGAIIELVKNCYDADSKICIVYFDVRHHELPVTLSPSFYKKYLKETNEQEAISIIELCYEKSDDSFQLKKDIPENAKKQLEYFFKSKNKLYIIDSGEGMTEDVIDKHWMTIGTSNKLSDVVTNSGRIKAGAKGIGRFALDRLGSICEMITKPEPESEIIGYNWKVDWENFQEEGITLGEIQAEFKEMTPMDYKHEVKNNIPDLRITGIVDNDFKNQGTILKVSELRDWWSETEIEKLYQNLEVLSPPNKTHKFDIFLFDKRIKNKFGKVNNKEFEDYDYKLTAKYSADKNIEIRIDRNEFNVNAIDRTLFKRKQMQVFPYDHETFRKGHYVINKSIQDILAPLVGTVRELEFDRLGEFEFVLYFMKLSENEENKRRFFYRNFSRPYRVEWFNKFGGIKVFRDNFRVRPYGEVGSTSFDWLSLGERKAQSPAGIAKKGGGYKLAPNQVAGALHISRIANLKFVDKSSREGFQENETFIVLKELLEEIISIVEEDKSTIAREMDLLYREKDEVIEAKSRADEIVEENKSTKSSKGDDCCSERDTLKLAYGAIKSDYDDAKEEIRILRALATTGLMVTSFGHEFRTLRNQMERRTNNLRSVIEKLLDEEKLSKELENRHNPFKRIDAFKKYDKRLKHWLDFSLAAIRKDKRSSETINLSEFLTEFNDNWIETLKTREVELEIKTSTETELEIKAFTIDIESIFNNLLINSFDAFDKKGFTGERKINITIDIIYEEEEDVEYLIIDYSDSGPGIPEYISNPYVILKPGYTTKIDRNGMKIGTGIGMWIVDTVVDYYNGVLEIIRPKTGFNIVLKLPYRK